MPRFIIIVVALLALAGGVLTAARVARGQTTATSGPARGHASVVAQGVAAIPSGDLAWRVTRSVTPAAPDSPARVVPGFILVDAGTLVLNDVQSGGQNRLAAGEAAFAPANTARQEVLASDVATAWYRIDLVAATEVNNAGGDELLFVGEPFASPGGNRDVDLVRDILAADESVDLAVGGQAAPVLLLVTSGVAELTPAANPSAAPIRLAAGQGAALGGDVSIRPADGAAASFVTAVIGPEVAPILAQEAAPVPASLTVQGWVCPVAYEGINYAADCLEPLTEVAFTLESPEVGYRVDGVTGADGVFAFTDLVPSTYALGGGVPGEFANQLVSCADEAGPVANEMSQTLTLGGIFTLAEGDDIVCAWYVIPEDLRGETDATITVTAFLCPGTPIDPATDCTAGDPSGVVIDGPVVLTTDASGGSPEGSGVSYVWGEEGELPFGAYFLQPGGIPVPEGYELSEVRGSAGGSGNGWSFAIDEANPSAVLEVIYVPASQDSGTADDDLDGLTAAQEAELGTDPANPDSDGDGLFDGPEVAIGTNPALYDSDGDGFGDNQEAVSGSDPLDPGSVPESEPAIDTDGDGLTDAQEEDLGTNAATPDSDGDGLTDFAEVGFEPGSATGTDPTRFDTDGDGAPDGVEVANGTDPTEAASR